MVAEGPDGALHEEFLWSLGVGAGLPSWLKELRAKERAEGKNQTSRITSRDSGARPGLGPQRDIVQSDVMVSSTLGSDRPLAATLQHGGSQSKNSGAPYDAGGGSTREVGPLREGPSHDSVMLSSSQGQVARVPVRDALPRHPQTVSIAAPEVLDAENDSFRWQRPELNTRTAAPLAPIAEVVAPSFASTAKSSSVPVAPERTAASPAAPAPGPKAPERAVASPAAPAPAAKETRFGMSIKDWLNKLDESGFLAQYNDVLVSKMGSVDYMEDNYVKAGELDVSFFEHAGVKKLGHKRMFEKWFKENC